MLSVDQIFSFEIAKFTFQYESKKLLVIFDNYFNLIKDASNYATRSAIKNNFCLPLYKLEKEKKSIKYLGVKIWNDTRKNAGHNFPKIQKSLPIFFTRKL